MSKYLSSSMNAGIVKEALERLKNGESIIVFDVETTGLAYTVDRILSFSAIKMALKDGFLIENDRMDLFINPGFPIPPVVTAINHISNETVKDCDKEDKAAIKIREFLGEEPFIAGYNSVSFDAKFMNAMYQRVFGTDFSSSCHVDVYKLAKEKFPGLKSHKLECVAKELGTDAGIEFHNSMDDVIVTARSFKELLDMYKEDPVIQSLMRVRVKNARFWDGPNRTLKRIYVGTTPYTKSYFDCYYGRWVSEDERVDLDALRKDVLEMYGVSDEKALLKALI